MAKYLDEPGLIHFMTLIKTAISNVSTTLIARTHRHSIGKSTGSSATVTAGTAASLSTTTKTFVTSASKLTMGTAASITPVTKKTVVTGGSKTSIPNVTSVGSAPTLGTAFSIPNVTSMTDASVSGHTLVITDGTLGTNFSVPNVTSAGSAPTLGTAIQAYTSLTTGDSVTTGTAVSVPQFTVDDAPTDTVKGVDTFTANTPTAVTPKTVVTSVDANTGYASI